jgi:hypothetical protein
VDAAAVALLGATGAGAGLLGRFGSLRSCRTAALHRGSAILLASLPWHSTGF